MNIITLWSLMLGLGSSLLPNFFFRRCFFCAAAITPQMIVRLFYIAEVLKFVTMIVLQGLILNLIPVNIRYFFLAFIGAELSRLISNYVRLCKIR
jgi:F0F1-type ATP synthase assembly protein I